MNLTVITYLSYLIISIAITIWVARTLRKNGHRFLVDAFLGDENLATSVNHLLVVGFYLINIGFISFNLKIGMEVTSTQEIIEALSTKVGVVLGVLGAMHFFNIYVLSRLRKRALNKTSPPPLPPNRTTDPLLNT